MTKKALALFFALVIGISALTACSKHTVEAPELVTQQVTKIVADKNNFKLSFSQSDSLNPYESDTLNNQVVQDLVFEPLFRLDENFETEPEIASSYAYTDSKTLKVTIISGLYFSDGSKINAETIVNAFNEAKSSPYWKNSLSPILSAEVNTSTSVIFHLKYANPFAHKLLTFYIGKNLEDSKFPIGSGRYKFSQNKGKIYLVLNKKYKEEFNPRFTSIQLVNVPATDSINNALNIGNISFAFRDLSSEDVARLRVNKKTVSLNNLVFIGLNSEYGITSNKYIRQAVSLAIDRSALVKSSYQGYAKEATSVFNPASKLGMQTKIFSKETDNAAALQAISKSGYGSDRLGLSLLVKKSNPNMLAMAKLVKQQLEAVGIKVVIKDYNTKDYLQCLKNKSYNIYIGETKIPNDMRLTSFLTSKGATSYGINVKSETAKTYVDYLNGDAQIGKFTLSFSDEMPFVPVLYRQGIICYSKAMHGDVQGYNGNFFSNIEDWYYN